MADVKDKIAQYLLNFSLATFAILGIVSLGLSYNSPEHIQHVLSAFLPIIATWVGTLLAYYYSKENFESANQNTKQLIERITSSDDKLKSIYASSVMIPFGKIISEKWDNSLSPYKAIKDTLKIFDDKSILRLLFADNDRRFKYIIHKSTFDSVIAKETINKSGLIIDTFTFELFLKAINEKYAELKPYVDIDKSAGFISKDASLIKAKEIMVANPSCQDVFVTANGKKDEEILGWITNKIIEENSRV